MQHVSGCFTSSPPSSPSLTPADSSPPSSPGLHAICTPSASPGYNDPFAGSSKLNKRPRMYDRSTHKHPNDVGEHQTGMLTRPGFDVTPTRLNPHVVDPFSASAKQEWQPPTHEKKICRAHTNTTFSPSPSISHCYASRTSSPTPKKRALLPELDVFDDVYLTDDESQPIKSPGKLQTRDELEHQMWDQAIADAIDKLNCVIDLSGVSMSRGPITHIPSSIADLESFTVLSPPHPSSSADLSPTLSPAILPATPFSASRPFTRATTLPAAAFNETFLRSKNGERLRGTPVARAASLHGLTQQPTNQLRRREITMYLASNYISQLPPELFRVTALTVLILRLNELVSIPPQIAQLTALRELSLSQNKLQWLPAEMLNMRLTKLTVFGNPWLHPLEHPGTSFRSLSHRPPASETIEHFSVPPLTETCLRILVAPYNHDASDLAARPLTVLEACYALPLTEDLPISSAVLATLRTCVPAAVARPAEDALPTKVRRDELRTEVHSRSSRSVFSSRNATADADDDVFAPRPPSQSRVRPAVPPISPSTSSEEYPGLSLCPSPRHRAEDGAWAGGRVPVFVRAAEERWTWQEVIAGVRVGAEGVGGVGVPVRWRGCSRGCLAFLDPPRPDRARKEDRAVTVQEEGAALPALDLGLEGNGSAGGEVDMDLQLNSVGQAEGGLADPDDFEARF